MARCVGRGVAARWAARVLGVIAMTWASGWSVPALAQDGATQDAKRHFDIGQALYMQGKFQPAAERFEKAFAAKPFPAFLFNAAVCLEKSKDFVKALKLYEQFLTLDPHSNDRSLVKKRIKAIRSHLNPPTPTTRSSSQPATPELPSLPPIETKGVVVIESSPEGAAIYLDAKEKGIFTRTPYTGSLPPGQHTIILEIKEFKRVQKTITVQRDVLSYLYFSLSRERNLGWIEVKGNIPGASLYLDKREFGAVGRTPYSGHLRPGKRKLIIDRPGYEPVIQEIEVVAGKTHVLNFTLHKVQHGWLKVTGRTTRGAKVLVDGKPFDCGSEFPCRGKITKGKHLVTVAKEDFKDYSTEVVVASAHEVQVAVRLNPKPSRIKAYVSLGVAVAFLAGGITTGIISNNRHSAISDDMAAGKMVDSQDARLTEGKVFAVVANAAFALSGVAAALGVYYLFRKEGAESYGEANGHKIAITPIIGPNVAGFGGQLRF